MTQCDGICTLRKLTELIPLSLSFGECTAPNQSRQEGNSMEVILKVIQLLYSSLGNSGQGLGSLEQGAAYCGLCLSIIPAASQTMWQHK